MIIFSGLGFLPIVFLMIFGFGFATDNNGPMNDKTLAYIFILTGLASGAMGWWLRNRPAKVLIDKATGQEVVLRRRHSLFFVPMFYWGPIFIAMGVYELIQAAMKH
jgi:hypothetical protein